VEEIRYKVVVNHEEQYALWAADKSNAPGWRDTGVEGMKADCLAYVCETWTDMRPLSLRRAVQGSGRGSASVFEANCPNCVLA
jgi:MbtH protein